MTIALKIGDDESQVKGFIYLDAVTVYTKSLSGKVTSFPVDSGVNISDHFISNNQKFTIEGVVSNVDISGISDNISIGDEKPINASPRPSTPTIYGQTQALQYLPTAARQFFERSNAGVLVDSESQNTTQIIEALFEELMRATYYNTADKRWRNKMTITTLYEMEGTNFRNAKTDLVITDVGINENPDTGDALFLSISLEKVRFVSLANTEMPKLAAKPVQKKITPTEDKGKVNGDTGTQASGQQGKTAGSKLNAVQKLDVAAGNWAGAKAGISSGAQ